MHAEVEGWTKESEYVSAVVHGRPGETMEELIARALLEEGITEIGSALGFPDADDLVYFRITDRTTDEPSTYSISGADAVEWRKEFARQTVDPDVTRVQVMTPDGQTLAEYTTAPTAQELDDLARLADGRPTSDELADDPTPTVSERIRRRRAARAAVTGDDNGLRVVQSDCRTGWLVVDSSGQAKSRVCRTRDEAEAERVAILAA